MSASNESARTPTPASRAPLGGGRSTAPAGRSGSFFAWVKGARTSAWFPVVAKSVAVGAGMLALSAIGAVSALSGAGVPVASAAAADFVAVAPPSSAKASAVALAAPSAAPARGTPNEGTAPAPGGGVTADGKGTAPAPGGGVTADGKVVLNRATAEELRKLPRVGPKRAEAIVELRQRLGRFRQPTDLLRVRGIGRKTLRLMLPLLVVDDPESASGAPAHAAGHPPAPPPKGANAS
jgi:competence protein ComEA